LGAKAQQPIQGFGCNLELSFNGGLEKFTAEILVDCDAAGEGLQAQRCLPNVC
jgi:hypothetical protein